MNKTVTRRKRHQLNNRGISLVELIVTMAIAAIVSLGIITFIITSYNQYRSQNSNINLQYEAQLTMNQLEDMILNASNGVSFDAATKTLTLYNQTSKPQEDGTVAYENVISVISWDESAHQLILTKYLYNPDDGSRTPTSGNQLMAEYITDFEVNLDELESKHVVNVSLHLALDTKSYNTDKDITIRNHIGKSSDGTAFKTLHIVNPAVATNLLIQPESMLVKRGTTAATGFTTMVQGENFPLQDVVWKISDATPPQYPDTTVVNPTTGQLTIDNRETATVFELVASTATPGETGAPLTKSVSVYNVYADGISLTLDPVESETKGIARFNVSGKNLTYADVNAGKIHLNFYTMDDKGNIHNLSSDALRVTGSYEKTDQDDSVRELLHYSVTFELLDAAYMDQRIYCVASTDDYLESAPAEILFESREVKNAKLILADTSGNEATKKNGVYSLNRDQSYKVGLEVTYKEDDTGKDTVEQIFSGDKKWEKYNWSVETTGGNKVTLDNGKFSLSSGSYAWGNSYTLTVTAQSKYGGTDFKIAAQLEQVKLEIVETGGVDQTVFPLCTNGGDKQLTFCLTGIGTASGYGVQLASNTPSYMDVFCNGMRATIKPKSARTVGEDKLRFVLTEDGVRHNDVTTEISIVMGKPNLYWNNWGKMQEVNNSVYLFDVQKVGTFHNNGKNGYYLLADTGSANPKFVPISYESGFGHGATYYTNYDGRRYYWATWYGWDSYENADMNKSGWVIYR